MRKNRKNEAVVGIEEEKSYKTNEEIIASWDLNKVNVVYDLDGVPVPVPKGYVGSSVADEKRINTGFVIYEGETEVDEANLFNEQQTRNQWVWVPVNDLSRIYEEDENGKKYGKTYVFSATGRTLRTGSNAKREPKILTNYDNEKYFSENGMQGMTRNKFLQRMQIDFESTIKSIEKYGGFYIGRYETGDLSKKVPVVKKMNTDIHSQTWYAMYSKMEYLGANRNIKSNMIWGCLWDETLEWLVESGNKTYEEIRVDSTSWGNYSDSTFTYTTTSGSTSTKNEGSRTIIPTGSSEYTKANNIYDMAGNVDDCTLEAHITYYRYSRCGDYYGTGSNNPSSNRNNNSPGVSSQYCGARAYFIIL